MTVKKLTDLPGLMEDHLPVLEEMGVRSVDDLAEALKDEEFVKKAVTDLRRVGPKTVAKWQDALADRKPAKAAKKEAKAEAVEEKPAKAEKKPKKAEKPAKAEKEAKVEIVEAEEPGAYAPRPKPELDDAIVDGLARRAIISGGRPAFKRQEWHRRKKLGEMWRRPKGHHSKMRRNYKRRPPMVSVGYRGPAAVRGYHPSGFQEVMVYNVDDLEGIDPKTQAARIGATVGTRKRVDIQERADELEVRILNRTV
ncbi:MAG: 50S ribosomal protein L32e [Thermoplasmatales archaeon]|nr:50S ribosomal protein L32e [Thermoplasmatales archaeon]